MAADDLPLPVVNLLNAIGVPWPYVDEQAVAEFASLVRRFGRAVETTHEDATRQVAGAAAAYASAASERMADGWRTLSARHVAEIAEGCVVLASALEAAADYIVAAKAAAAAALLAMTAEFAGDQVAAFFTAGAADAVLPVLEETAAKTVQSLVTDLEQYLLSRVVGAALKPLVSRVGEMLSGLDWQQSGTAPAGRGAGLELDAPEARARARALEGYASDMASHARTFSAGIRAVRL